MATPEYPEEVGKAYAYYLRWKISYGPPVEQRRVVVFVYKDNMPRLVAPDLAICCDGSLQSSSFTVIRKSGKKDVLIQVEGVSNVFNDSDACLTNAIETFRTDLDREWKKIQGSDRAMKNIPIYHYNGDDDEILEFIESHLESKSDFDVEENIDERSTESQTDFVDGIGSGLAYIYYKFYLLPAIRYLKECAKKDDQSPKQMVVLCSSDENILEIKGNCISVNQVVGYLFKSDENKCKESLQADIYNVTNSESGKHVHCFLSYPETLLTLKSLQNRGKLTDRQYDQELKRFHEKLSNLSQTENQIHIISDDDFKDSNLQSHLWKLLTEESNYGSNKFMCDCDMKASTLEHKNGFKSSEVERIIQDLETDGEPGNRSKNGFLSNDTDLVFISYYVNGCEDTWTMWDFSDGHYFSKSRESERILDTDTIILSAKQSGIIDANFSAKLNSTSKDTPISRAKIVIGLLSIIITKFQWYNRLTESIKANLERINTDKPDCANNIESCEAIEVKDKSKISCDAVVTNENPVDKPVEKPVGNSAKLSKSNAAKKEKNNNPTAKIEEVNSSQKKIKVIQDILFNMIEDKKFLVFDFEIQLRKLAFDLKCDVSCLRNREDLTLLHSMIIKNRQQFMLPLFRVGCWSDIHALKVGKGHEYDGRTSDELCTLLNMRKIQKEIDSFTVWEKSMNLVHKAARKGDLAEVKKYVKFSEDLHKELDDKECTTLYWAVVGGNIDIVNLLLKKNVDYEKANNRKETLLHAACMMGHSHLLQLLVWNLKFDLTVKDMAKKSALLRISENGDEKSLDKLMECGMDKEFLGPLLAIAGHYGRLSFIKKVVEKYGLDPQSKDEAGKSALLRASDQGQMEVLKYLFSKKINIGEADVRKRNVLHVAADGADKAVVEILVNEFKKRTNGELKQYINARDKYIGGELCMLIRGKDKGRDSWHYVEVSRGLMDIFMKKTRGGTIDVAKFGTLLHSGWGADPDEESAKDIEKRFEARRNASSAADDLDMTPLHIAAFKDKLDVAELLLENGADPNVRDKFGMTALHIAAMRGNVKMGKLLIENGAMTDILDNLVKTPAEVANDNEHKEMANFLKGSTFLPIAQNFRDAVIPNIQRLLSEQYIQQILENGSDLRTHLINTLRDLTVDINESLLALGSGPVLEETSEK